MVPNSNNEQSCNMKIIKPNFQEGKYTRITNNIVNDERLDLKEKGLMLHILSKPDGWFLNVDEIAKNNRDGKKSIYAGIKKLKELGYIILNKHVINGKIFKWEYLVNTNPSIDIIENLPLTENVQVENVQVENVQVENVQVENRHYNNTNSNKTNINNTKVSKLKETYQLSEIENVENSIIEFADKSEEEEIKKAFDELLDGRLDITPSNIDSLKKQVSKFRKVRPVKDTIELIKLLPDFVKASKLKNSDKVYEDRQSLVYLVKILENDLGSYPKWFLDSQKQEVVENAVNELEKKWNAVLPIWRATKGGSIDNSIKLMISNILNFIQDYDYHEKNDLEYNDLLHLEFFKEAVKNTIKKKSIEEVIEIIKDYSSKEWHNLDSFKKVLNNFFDSGLGFGTVASYFETFGDSN